MKCWQYRHRCKMMLRMQVHLQGFFAYKFIDVLTLKLPDVMKRCSFIACAVVLTAELGWQFPGS